MRTWVLQVVFVVVFGGLAIGLGVGAAVSGETPLWFVAGVFGLVAVIAACFIPRARREQQDHADVSAEKSAVGSDGRVWAWDALCAEVEAALADRPVVVESGPDRIEVRANLADATFLSWAAAHHVNVVRGLEVIRTGTGGAVIRDWERDLDVKAGTARMTGRARVQSGASWSRTRRIEWGAGTDGRISRQVDITFSPDTMRRPVTEVLKRTGWHLGWYGSLPADAKGAVWIGALGASSVVLVPLAFLVKWLVG